MAAAEKEERGRAAGKLHHCQEGPICRNKGLHLSCQALDLTKQQPPQYTPSCARLLFAVCELALPRSSHKACP